MTWNACILLQLSLAVGTIAQPAAFPGALGFGSKVTGGRTGTVYHVSNLNDAGSGSFRDAVSVPNRIVIFDVSGYIALKSAVSVKSNLTIAGQTAPGDGIGFRGGKVSCGSSSNIIIRHVRFRPGSETASNEDVAINLYNARDIILDHCSIEFAPWNNIGGVSDDWQKSPVTNITIQSCLIADPTYQQFGAHCESVSSDWSWFYNIFANSHNRNPLAKTNTVFMNNVLYNYSAGYTTHTSTAFKHDIINNYFIFGPASTGTDNTWFQIDKQQSIYTAGNLKDNNLDGTLNGAATTPYWYQGEGTVLSKPWSTLSTSITALSPASAYRLAVSRSGTLPRDQMDSLIINQIRTLGKGPAGLTAGTAGPGSDLYTSQSQTGLGNNGYGTIRSGTKETDTDSDGMPDFWEKAIDTKVNEDDAMTIISDGYANIERYINWIADLHARTETGKPVSIDLAAFSAGFPGSSPTIRISAAINGNATMAADGHTAAFTPADGFHGLASFTFTITGADNSGYGGTMTIAVIPSSTAAAETFSVNRVRPHYTISETVIAVEGDDVRSSTIIDASGRTVLQTMEPAINVSRLKAGVYIISTGMKSGTLRRLLVLQ
jgi:hypothetical protein